MGLYIYRPDPAYRGARVDSGGTSRKLRLQVETNNPHLDEDDIQVDSGYKYGDPDPLDATKTLQSIEVNRDGENPYFWELLLEYRRPSATPEVPNPTQLPPLLRPPDYDWSYEEKDEQVDKTAEGDPICTMCGESYDPPLTKPVADLVASVTFFTESWNASDMRGKVNGVNAAEWYGWPKGTVRFCAPRARSYYESPWPPCIQVTFTFKCRPDGWTTRVLHAGYIEWTGEYDDEGQKLYKQIKTDDGKLIEERWPLDEEGKRILMGENGKFVRNLVWIEYPLLHEIDFSELGV